MRTGIKPSHEQTKAPLARSVVVARGRCQKGDVD
jgi:hypothetical protein